MDEKFTRRFESFKNSLDSLAEAKEREIYQILSYSAEPVQNSASHLIWHGKS